MAQKKLEPSSDFEKYDLDADGVVSDAEIARAEKKSKKQKIKAVSTWRSCGWRVIR